MVKVYPLSLRQVSPCLAFICTKKAKDVIRILMGLEGTSAGPPHFVCNNAEKNQRLLNFVPQRKFVIKYLKTKELELDYRV